MRFDDHREVPLGGRTVHAEKVALRGVVHELDLELLELLGRGYGSVREPEFVQCPSSRQSRSVTSATPRSSLSEGPERASNSTNPGAKPSQGGATTLRPAPTRQGAVASDLVCTAPGAQKHAHPLPPNRATDSHDGHNH